MEGPPPGLDLSATQVPRILGVNIATFCLAVIAITLRFTARRLTHAAFWWDDWLMIPAIVRRATSADGTWTNDTPGFRWSDVLCLYNLQ